MPSPLMLWHFLLETFVSELPPRVPEPVQIMDDIKQAGAYAHEGEEQGFLAPLYLFHAIQAAALIRPGDRVLDLACGPGNQLYRHARINPSARFIGIDAAEAMLELGRQKLAGQGVENVELRTGLMPRLEGLEDASMDVVICTMSLHHLADYAALEASFEEMRRVLKPEGRIYIADFGRLKRVQTQRFLANQNRRQPDVFRTDYLNSLRAAFSVEELCGAARSAFGDALELKQTDAVPLFVVLLSRNREGLAGGQQASARRIYSKMSWAQRLAFRDMARFFRQGGFPLASNPW